MDEKLPDDTLAKMAVDDVEAFAHLYRRHLQRVYSYILSRVGNVQDAQDLTSKTFISALTSMRTYEPRGYFVAWLFKIAKRKLSDHFRDDAVEVSIDDISPVPDKTVPLDDKVIQHLHVQEITSLLTKLNPERAEALRLRYFADLKIREVAELMDKSEGAVKMLISRGLDDIRQALGIQEEIS